MQTMRVVLAAIFLGLFGLARPFVNSSALPGASLDIRTEDQLNMSNSISTLLTRNLQEVFGENDPARRRAAIDQIFTEDCVFYDPNKGVYRGRGEIDRIAARSGLPTVTFGISQLPSPRKRATAGGSDG